MLNPFPELLTYGLLAPFILRVVVGLVFVDLGILKFKGEKKRWLATFEALSLRPAEPLLSLYGTAQVIGGLMLIFGFYTQIAALVLAIFTGTELYLEWKENALLKRNIVFYILIFTVLISLLLSGAGAFARDLPL
jgi:uncharacterized membrane protein YphA (DoxX/SURF4 family)